MATLTLGTNIRERREDAQLSREKLARLADVSTATIARIELNDHVPTVTTLWHIARALGVPMEALVSESGA